MVKSVFKFSKQRYETISLQNYIVIVKSINMLHNGHFLVCQS